MDPIERDSKSEPDAAWRYLLKRGDPDSKNCLEVRSTALNYELDRLAVEMQKQGRRTASGQRISPLLSGWKWNATLGGDYFPAKSFTELPKEARSRVSAQFHPKVLTVYETAMSEDNQQAKGKKQILREAAKRVVEMAYDFQLACIKHQDCRQVSTADVASTADPFSVPEFCGPYVPVVVPEVGEGLPARFRDLTEKRQSEIILSVCRNQRWLHAVLRENRSRLLGRSDDAIHFWDVRWVEVDHQAVDEERSPADLEAAGAAGLLEEGRIELLPWLVSATVRIDLRFPKTAVMSQFEEKLEVFFANGRQKGKPISVDNRPPAHSPEQKLKQLALVRLREKYPTVDQAKDWLEQRHDWNLLKKANKRKKESDEVLVPSTWSKAQAAIMKMFESR
jgi:hypothetical protein